MEAMVVVAVIAISAALAAPAISEAMADRRATEAAHGLVRIGARARAEAMAYGRAHVLVYTDASSGSPATNGRVQLWRGTVNLCGANDWTTIIGTSCAGNPNCVDELDMGTYNHGSHQVQLRLPGAGAAYLCFQPDGELLVSTGGGAFSPTPPAGADAVRFTINRFLNGGVDGVQRVVVFPFGGTPRIQR
jgi:type II secretory pathway pseudopilin PulG